MRNSRNDEPGLLKYDEAIAATETDRLPAATYVEVGAVVDRKREPGAARGVDDLIEASAMIIEPVTGRRARIAREAHRCYGRGSGHPARLSFGDCLAHALSRDMREPLLYKGDDFARTDIEPG